MVVGGGCGCVGCGDGVRGGVAVVPVVEFGGLVVSSWQVQMERWGESLRVR